MEFFLLVLVVLMIGALISGFPVAFALPGAAIAAIALAALFGWLLVGDSSAFFIDGGPQQWLTAGVTNFRSLYWEVERDTLIAIPLFIFMGIMLQRSRVAEDLLVAMAQLFGPVPGGLGISVVIVGAMLAATTGIVGATVVAMGMISLPAMLRNQYDRPLATGTICASGTLGQIIPPSVVLIILADQLSSAADQASTLRAADYRAATGEFSLPGSLDVVSASAGDMFMGAIVPGFVLVFIYIVYLLVRALLNPQVAPPVPYEGRYDRDFWLTILRALVPPLALIILVLGSILAGVATVNQAGAIGAIGALLMGGYRIYQGDRHVYTPVLMAAVAVLGLVWVRASWDINVKDIAATSDLVGIVLAILLCLVLAAAVFWSLYRVFKAEDTLTTVMADTAKTTSMVFIILIGAAMLTAAFRAFGGEELVRHALTSLPGGFWTQFIVVMLVIFLLGFFLDFIEIAVVVVPLVAPILLASPEANITAVWLGVMIGLNMQTSFLTPPFGFALFYLRGVAPKIVKTLHIYKGVIPFIGLQLLALLIVGLLPPLVNYLPKRTYLTSENAPPPMNPQLQQCIEAEIFPYYRMHQGTITAALDRMAAVDVALLPLDYQTRLADTLSQSRQVFTQVAAVETAAEELQIAAASYRPLHRQVRGIEQQVRQLEAERSLALKFIDDARFDDAISEDKLIAAQQQLTQLASSIEDLRAQIPAQWSAENAAYQALTRALRSARLGYQNLVDNAYRPLNEIIQVVASADQLALLEAELADLAELIELPDPEQAMAEIRALEDRLIDIPSADPVLSLMKKARRALRGEQPDRAAARAFADQANTQYEDELAWLRQAQQEILPQLRELDAELSQHIGLRLQPRLPESLALSIAACQSTHRDVSLNF